LPSLLVLWVFVCVGALAKADRNGRFMSKLSSLIGILKSGGRFRGVLLGTLAATLFSPLMAKADDLTLTFETLPGRSWATVRTSELLKFIRDDQSRVTQQISDRARTFLYQWDMEKLKAKAALDGNFHYGALNFRDLFSNFEKVKFYILSAPVKIEVSAERPSDIYLLGKNAVILNQDFFKAANMGRAGVVLHTLLGASGYQDENYQLSTLLHIANLCLNQSELDGQSAADVKTICESIDMEKSFPQNRARLFRPGLKTGLDLHLFDASGAELNRSFAEGGGGGFTGVGGGGDYRAVIFKMGMMGFAIPEWRAQIVERECSERWPTTQDFLNEFLPMRIEISETVREVKFSTDKILVPANIINQPRATGEAIFAIIRHTCAGKAGKL
jgi:hypothetical protein